MPIIYEPRGKAKEYADLAANLYIGCDHGCKYCYAPSATYKTREAFTKPRVRPGVIAQIAKEAPAYAGREVLLSFTCDVYSSFATEQIDPIMQASITRQAIDALHLGGCHVTILTKGGKRSTADFDILKPGDKYGATLTFDNPADSQEWEPGAALPEERIAALREAHARNITTWVSFEPVIKPSQTLALMKQVAGFVDLYKIGKWNHDARSKEIDWLAFAEEALDIVVSLKKEFIIKKDLLRYFEAI